MNNNFDTGLLNKYLTLKENDYENMAIFENNLYRVKISENKNRSKRKIKGGYVNIDKEKLKSILYEYHEESSKELIEAIKNKLKYNSELPKVNFEINEDEIDRFLFNNFLNKLTLLDSDFNIYGYNIIHQDVITEENFNEISERYQIVPQ